MADKPIIFSAPMVRALLDGRKTQTRRIAKITAIMGNKVAVTSPDESLIELEPGEFQRGVCHYASTGALSGPYKLPYAIGDRLYVREAHAFVGSTDPGYLLYRANGYENECARHGFDLPCPPETEVRWRPSIHMPRWASRLTLTVTDVRVQRLIDISETDATAEGVSDLCGYAPAGFRLIWEDIHGPDAWTANPWVVAVSFDVRKGNIDVP